MASAADTLKAVVDTLGLDKSADAETIMAAIKARETRAAAVARMTSDAKYTMQVNEAGFFHLRGVRLWLGSDELDVVLPMLASDEFRIFIEAHRDQLRTRSDGDKWQEARRKANREATKKAEEAAKAAKAAEAAKAEKAAERAHERKVDKEVREAQAAEKANGKVANGNGKTAKNGK
jgi:hypothetical protein